MPSDMRSIENIIYCFYYINIKSFSENLRGTAFAILYRPMLKKSV